MLEPVNKAQIFAIHTLEPCSLFNGESSLTAFKHTLFVMKMHILQTLIDFINLDNVLSHAERVTADYYGLLAFT
jgi:hypothetical protein